MHGRRWQTVIAIMGERPRAIVVPLGSEDAVEREQMCASEHNEKGDGPRPVRRPFHDPAVADALNV